MPVRSGFILATSPLSGSVCSDPEKMVDRLSDDLATLLLDQQGGVDFDQEDDFDLVLVAKAGEHVPVHSILLKARSPFFLNLLSAKPFLLSLFSCREYLESMVSANDVYQPPNRG